MILVHELTAHTLSGVIGRSETIMQIIPRASAAGTKRYDDQVGGRDRFVDDERPSCGLQNRLPNGENSNDGSRGQCNHH